MRSALIHGIRNQATRFIEYYSYHINENEINFGIMLKSSKANESRTFHPAIMMWDISPDLNKGVGSLFFSPVALAYPE